MPWAAKQEQESAEGGFCKLSGGMYLPVCLLSKTVQWRAAIDSDMSNMSSTLVVVLDRVAMHNALSDDGEV